MSTRAWLVALILMAAPLAGCPSDTLPSPDAGPATDAGPSADTSPANDAGPDTSPADVGADAAPPDTGPSCAAPNLVCGGQCVDLQTSSAHCGACDQACASSQTCQAGQCVCTGGQTLCADTCVDVQTSSAHCGACGQACAPGEVCGSGQCQPDQNTAGVLQAINDARATSSDCGVYGTFDAAPPVAGHPQLHAASQAHAVDMADNDFFDHTGSNGSSFSQRISQAGYPGRPVGENIAAGSTSPAGVVQLWMDSDGHCRNIMNADANEIGVGFAQNPNSQWRSYWVLKLGRR